MKTSIEMTAQERDAILAGLRLLQDLSPDNHHVFDIYTNCAQHSGLTPDGIDALCERVNGCLPQEATEYQVQVTETVTYRLRVTASSEQEAKDAAIEVVVHGRACGAVEERTAWVVGRG